MMNTFLDAMRMVGMVAVAVGITYFVGGLSLDHSGFADFGLLVFLVGLGILGTRALILSPSKRTRGR